MAAIAGTMFFLMVLGFAGWVIASTIAPRLDRIAFLLRYGPAVGSKLPAHSNVSRITLRERSAPGRVAPAMRPAPLRLAA
jgi:hypothetical protein